jgi:transposase
MHEFAFTDEQIEELERAARTHRDAHVRSRAIALRGVACGLTCREVSRVVPITPYSIGQLVARYQESGLKGLGIAAGRGAKSSVDDKEVLSCLRQSPERFGLETNRWTLKALSQCCPTLVGMSERGVLKVLHRLGFRYKRGQPWIHSPDPDYEEKKTSSKSSTKKRAGTRRL